MKRLLLLLFFLFFCYFAVQVLFKVFGQGYNKQYEIKVDDVKFTINETYSVNKKNEMDNYYFNIHVKDSDFPLQIFDDFNRSEKIIIDMKYTETPTYRCILPIFKGNKILTDIICLKNNIEYYYHTIKKQDILLDRFADSLKDIGYNQSTYVDEKDNIKRIGFITVYGSNIKNNHYISLNSYKGMYVVNYEERIKEYKLFENDVYNQNIKALINNYYLIADYNLKYNFQNFILLNTISGKKIDITSKNKISFDSYVQGTVNNKVYLYDRDSKKQYAIDINEKSIKEVGNKDTGFRYYNKGNWEIKQIKDMTDNDLYFSNREYDNFVKNYITLGKVGEKSSGYYYFYQKNNNDYLIYRSNTQKPERLSYLFTTTNINNIKIVKDFIYFTDNDSLNYYSDKTGVRTLLINSEFEFNQHLFYDVYINN